MMHALASGPAARCCWPAHSVTPKMDQLGKILFIVGLAIAAVGLAIWALARLGFRGLPGDIVYQTNGLRIDIPIATCLVLSALLTLALWLWHWLSRGR